MYSRILRDAKELIMTLNEHPKLVNKLIWSAFGLVFLIELAPILKAITDLVRIFMH